MAVFLKNPVLFRRTEACEQGQNFDICGVLRVRDILGRAISQVITQCLFGIADIALTGKKYQNIPRALSA